MIEIEDKLGRVHDYLRISLTDRCNLRCFYCMPEEGVELTEKSNIMSIEEIIAIAKIFVSMGVKKIRLTGGEPLIRKGIDKLLRALGQLPVELALTTNGILIDQYLELLKEVGLKNISVSLDSLQEERNAFITKRNFNSRIMANIKLLLENDFDVKLNVVLMKNLNVDEITDFIEWGRNEKIKVKFIEFMPFSGNKWDWDKGIGQDEILQIVDNHFSEGIMKLEDAPHATSRSFKINGFKGSFGVISTVTNPFCDSCNRIRLTTNGRIKNCLFSNDETDILTAFRQGNAIQPLILESIQSKKKSRGGMESFEQFSDPELNSKNRSMITIGG